MANELKYSARLDIAEAKKSALELQKIFKEVGISPASNDNFKTSQLGLQDALRRSRLELQELKKTQQEYKNQQAESGAATAELTRKIAENRLEQQQLIAATRSARAANVAVSGSYKEAQQQLTALGNSIKSVEGGFNNLGKVQQARIKEYNELNNKLKAFDAQMGNNQRNVGNYKSALSSVKGELIGMIAQYASLAAVIGLVGKTFNQSLKSDSVRTSLEFTFGSVDLADAKLKQLLETANRLGVDYNALTSSYKSFAGAVIASNFDFQNGEKIFNAVAGASARLKLSSEDTEGALRALQQMISKGNVQAEELRGQLGERIPGAFSIAARAMNVTEAELNKMLQKGEVLAADLLPKLATELEKTFDTNSEERVEGLAAAWGRLTNVFSGTVAESGRITKFFTALIDGVGEASKAIANMVNSSSWNEFVARLFVNDNGKTGDNIRSITDAVEKSQKVINKSYDVDANSGAKKILTTYEEVKIAYEKANKALTIFKKGVADGSLVEKGANTIQTVTTRVNALNSEMNRLKNNLPANSINTPVKSKKQINEEEDAAKKAKAARDKAERENEQALEKQRTLQAKFDEINDKAKRKTLSDDEEEIANIKAKYDNLRAEAIKFNTDKNNIAKGLKVNTSGLNIAQTTETETALDKQSAVILKAYIAEQKVIFDEYESYKSKIGLENAKKLVGDKIDVEKTYLEYLQKLEEDLANDPKAKGGTGEQGKEQQLKVLRESIAAQEAIQKKSDRENYANLLASLVTYEQQRATLIEKYNEQRNLLIKNKEFAKLTVLDSIHKAEINQLDDQNNEKLSAYKALFENVEKLSKESLKKVIADGEKLLAKQLINGTISPELAKKTADQIAVLKDELNKITPDALSKVGDELYRLGGIISQTNEGFGKWITTLGSVVGGIGDISSKITALQKLPKGDVLGGISGGLGIAGAAFGVFQAVAGLLDKSAEQDEARKRATDYQIKQQDAMNKLLERQVALIQDAYGTGKLLKYSEALKTATDNQSKFTDQLKGRFELTGNDFIDKIITNLNNGLGKKGLDLSQQSLLKSLQKNSSALKSIDVSGSIEDLYKLLDNSKLDDATRNLLTNLIKAKEAIIDLGNSVKAELTGTTFEKLGDDIVDALSRGEDVGKNFEDAIRKAMINSLKSEKFKVELQKFYDNFALLSENDLTKEEIEILRAQYDKIVEDQKKRQQALEAVTGVKLSVETDSSNFKSFVDNTFGILLQSAEETGKSIEDILKDSILEGLKAQIFTDALKPLQTKIAALYKDGRIPTKEELAAITAEYTAFIDGAKAKLKEVEDATGLVFGEKIGEDLSAAAEKIKSEIQSISDSILDVFANSENALQDFEAKFNGMVKNTILKSLQETTLQGRLTEFYTEFNKLSTVSDAEKEAQVAKLRAQYNAIIKEGKDEYERLQDVFGVDYGSSAAKPSAAIGEGVQRITEDTANAIAGPIIGTFEQATKIANLMGKHYAIATQTLDMAVKTEANTRRTANNTDGISGKLDEIARNTRPKTGNSLSDSYTKI